MQYVITGILVSAVLSAQGVDLTRQPNAQGSDVVVASVGLILQSNIFPSDNGLLRRIAWVESADGTDPNTFRTGYTGGIWQVDQSAFSTTQNVASYPSLSSFYSQIQTSFAINWQQVTWADLTKPLYSALAARLYMSTRGVTIPNNLGGQSTYWKTYYDINSGPITAQQFVALVNQLEGGGPRCGGRINLCIVLDASGSIGSSSFQSALNFLVSVIGAFEIAPDKVQVAMITYDSYVSNRFGFLSSSTAIINMIQSTPYTALGTYTGQAMDYARTRIFNNSLASGVSAVMIVLTDGQSGDDVVAPAARVAAAGIDTYAVGIGSGISQSQLVDITNDIPERVLSTSFTTLSDITSRLTTASCSTPADAPAGTTLQRQMGALQSSFTRSDIPTGGLTISVQVTVGGVTVYASFTFPNPNAAFYDAIILPGESKYFASSTSVRKRATAGRQLYLGFYASNSSSNSFTASMAAGNGPASAASTDEPASGISTAALGGIIGGAGLLFLVAIVVIVIVVRRRRRNAGGKPEKYAAELAATPPSYDIALSAPAVPRPASQTQQQPVNPLYAPQADAFPTAGRPTSALYPVPPVQPAQPGTRPGSLYNLPPQQYQPQQYQPQQYQPQQHQPQLPTQPYQQPPGPPYAASPPPGHAYPQQPPSQFYYAQAPPGLPPGQPPQQPSGHNAVMYPPPPGPPPGVPPGYPQGPPPQQPNGQVPAMYPPPPAPPPGLPPGYPQGPPPTQPYV